MSKRPFGSEMRDLPPEIQDVLEEEVVNMGPGLFSSDERRVLLGMKSWEGLKNPQASRRSKRHQIRERVRNGLLDLLLASLYLPNEDWEAIVKADSPTPFSAMLDEPSEDFIEIRRCIERLSATLAFVSDGMETDEGLQMKQTMANAMARYHQLDAADEHNVFVETDVSIESEPGDEAPLYGNVTDESPLRRYVRFRAGPATRLERLRESLLTDTPPR